MNSIIKTVEYLDKLEKLFDEEGIGDYHAFAVTGDTVACVQIVESINNTFQKLIDHYSKQKTKADLDTVLHLFANEKYRIDEIRKFSKQLDDLENKRKRLYDLDRTQLQIEFEIIVMKEICEADKLLKEEIRKLIEEV